MAFLIEILQSLQKDPCGCDLTKGCYCGVDGVEDHEGKSPCYVCGEWFPDQVSPFGQQQQRQGRARHEQGSLRHHVAESRVKKWLDSVWRPPLTPATSPEQESVRQFGIKSPTASTHSTQQHQYLHQQQLKQKQHAYSYQQSHENQNCLQDQHQQQQYQQPIPRHPTWDHHSSPEYQQEQQQQQRMYPGRPWSFYDIELEARSKSRSRQSSSSIGSSFSPSPSSYHYSFQQPRQKYQQQHDVPEPSGYYHGSSSGSNVWPLTASFPKSVHSSTPNPKPVASPVVIQPSFSPQSLLSSMRAPAAPAAACADVHHQPRTRTLSCSDSLEQERTTQGRLPHSNSMTFIPPTTRPNSCNSNRKSRSVLAQHHLQVHAGHGSGSSGSATFAIPQEILDPHYKTPTFRIKSWNPPSSTITAVAPLTPSPSTPTPAQGSRSASVLALADTDIKNQALEEWTGSERDFSASQTPQETVIKTSVLDQGSVEDGEHDDRDQSMMIACAPTAQANGRAMVVSSSGASAVDNIMKEGQRPRPPLQFSFTSQRFRDIVQESLERAAATAEAFDADDNRTVTSSDLTMADSILQTAVCSELTASVTDVSEDDNDSEDGEDWTDDEKEKVEEEVEEHLETEKEEAQTEMTQPAAADTLGAKDLTSILDQEPQPNIVNSDNGTATARASSAPRLASELGLNHHQPVVQKSAPMSPLTPRMPNTVTMAAITSRNEPVQAFSTCLSSYTASCSLSRKRANDDSPIDLQGELGCESNHDAIDDMDSAEGESGSDIGKAASWTSLHRLMRRMSRNNEAIVASLPLGLSRMHLDGS
ncbi:hypothetical protein EDD11_001235 [Mortierella claussenii]|nr:hypothetical protein EDD11_001235 [Mortierella claussenii]